MSATSPPLSYRWRFVALMPVLMGFTIWRGIKDRSVRYVLQRLGFAYSRHNHSIWFHCASVGELNTAIPLIKEMQAQFKDMNIVISSNTCTSAEVFKKHRLERSTHCFLPLDSRLAIRRFLSAIKPRIAVIVETELWPNLYAQLAAADTPITIVNARLSQKTLSVKKPWLLHAYRSCLANVSAILARSDADAQAYIGLGAKRDVVKVLGNLKFAANEIPSNVTRLVQPDYVLLASTHHDEELQFTDVWKQHDSRQLLAIAPRHPERGDALAAQLRERGWVLAQRSRHEKVDAATDIYLADTVGELPSFIAFAQWVFVGGSLIARGGQNLLEPARAGKAIVCGPHMDNFADETKMLVEAGGAIQLSSIRQLNETISQLQCRLHCKQIGKNAVVAYKQYSDVASQYRIELVRFTSHF